MFFNKMADYIPQGYSSVVDRLKNAAYGIGDYASDIFSSVSDAIFGPPIELAPVYDEKMVLNEYFKLLGGGADLRNSYGGLERGFGSNFVLNQRGNGVEPPRTRKGNIKNNFFKRV